MSQPPRLTTSTASPGTSPPAAASPEYVASEEVVRLLRLVASLGNVRNDPRSWRVKLLDQVMELLPASAASAFILKNVVPESPPVVVSLFDAGFKPGTQRHAFLQEFNTAAFRDPFSRRTLDRFITSRAETFTALRSDLVDERLWNAQAQLQALRMSAGVDDCVLSVHRGTDRGTAYALYVFRAPQAAVPANAPLPPAIASGMGESRAAAAEGEAAARFGARERILLHALHAGLDGMYRAEESTHRLNRATELPPRLRQTLECLLGGDTERQVALKLSLSVHTVHDYVKALYTHFGVSSRGELLSKWLQTSGQLPPRKE